MGVEEKFDIEIPDVEAEQIGLVSDLATTVRSKIQFCASRKCLSQIIFHRIRKGLQSIGIARHQIRPDSNIADFLKDTDLSKTWQQLEKSVGLKLPNLVYLDSHKEHKRAITIFGIIIYKRVSPITENQVSKLIDWVISMNYRELINVEEVSSIYEVERIVCGILFEQHGIPVNEIEMHHSITKDLGLD